MRRRNSKKKITDALQEEIKKEIERIVSLSFRDRDKLGHLDLESFEVHIRSSMHHIGSIVLEKLLNSDSGDYRGKTLPCERGHLFELKEYQAKCLKFKVPKVPKVKGTRMTITCFGPVFIGLKMGFPILSSY